MGCKWLGWVGIFIFWSFVSSGFAASPGLGKLEEFGWVPAVVGWPPMNTDQHRCGDRGGISGEGVSGRPVLGLESWRWLDGFGH